jgi:ferrous iron transport protein B
MYLKKVGSIILIASIIIWMLSYFPRNTETNIKYQDKITQTEQQYNNQVKLLDGKNVNQKQLLEEHKNSCIDSLSLAQNGEQQRKSFIGIIGRGIEPVMKPLGFDWKMSICILSGLAAKEVVVSTMGVLYQAGNGEESQSSLAEKLQAQTNEAGQKVFSQLVAFAFMLFILIYFPCIGVIAAIKRESGSWKWAAFTVIYTTAAAWVIAFITFQIGSLFL